MSHGVRRMDLFVTEACNLACRYCYTRDARQAQRLDPALARRAVDWLLDGAPQRPHITFWGGEPLLEQRLMDEVVKQARERTDREGKRLSLAVPTNATLLDGGAWAWIDDHAVKLFLSIDGDAETQGERPLASGGSSFDRVRRALQQAVSRPPAKRPAVRMTVTPQHAPRLVHNVTFFQSLGVRELLVYPAYDADWSSAERQGLAAAEAALAEQLVDWIRSSDDPRQVVRIKPWLPILRRLRFGGEPRSPDGTQNRCGAGLELMAVNADGSLSACHRFTFYDRKRGGALGLGSVEAGVRPGSQRVFEDLPLSAQRGVTRCTQCELFDQCSLGCPAINYGTTGELHRVPDAACELMAARVAACRIVDEALADDPLYPLYLGQSTDAALRTAARRIGRQAHEHYHRHKTRSLA